MHLPRPPRIDVDELMDADDADPAAISGALDDLSRLNRLVGGTRLTLRALERAVAGLGVEGRPLRVLDVATGAADIPLAMLDHARDAGLRVRVTGLDRKPEMLDEARRRTGGRVELVQGDALALPFDDDAFDIVTCSLVLHHFAPDEARRVLEQMRRVSSGAVIVNDLVRAWHPWLVAKLFGVVSRNELTRFDGPASVLRAYTPDELLDLAADAGLAPRWRATLLGYRMVLLATTGTQPAKRRSP